MAKKKVTKKSEQRCEMFHKIGLEMFLKNGFEKTNLADIVKETGGSLSTIYQRYGNKEGFFEAVVFDEVEDFFEDLEKKLTQEEDQSLENFLYKFGREYIEIFCCEDTVSLGRIIYSEGFKDNGKISKLFKSRADDIISKIFVDYINSHEVKGLKFDNYESLAEVFCLLIREPEFQNAISGYKPNDLTQEQKDEKVKKVVDLFLNGCRES